MSHFKHFKEFLFESSSESVLHKAENLIKNNAELKEVLQGCVDGKYPKNQVIITQGCKSYVGIATNSGSPISEVFKTDDPKKALLAIVIFNTKQEDADQLIGMLKIADVLVEYAVFPGNKKLSTEELLAKYNLMYSDFSQFLPIFTGTPIVKKF